VIDLHIHTAFSPDSILKPARAFQAAALRGLEVIGFTEHAEFLPQDDAYVDHYDADGILEELERLRKTSRSGPELLFGVEIGYIPGEESGIGKFLDSHPFDYAIGSVHYVDGVLVSRWVRERELAGESFSPYFETVLSAVESGLFQVLGHLDYIRKYLFAPQNWRGDEYEELIDEILKAAAGTGTAVELNTSGWRHATEEPYPPETMLARLAELGGRATLGSDAHKYYEVGYANDRACALLRHAGFNEITVFRKGTAHQLPL